MKKFLIYLSSFLLLFGVSTAFAEIWIEDFEDEINPEWYIYGNYNITTVPGGSTGVHMLSPFDGPGSNTEVGTGSGNPDIIVYHFGADVYMSSNGSQNGRMSLELREADYGEWIQGLSAVIHFDPVIGRFQVILKHDGEIIVDEYLGTYNLDEWHSLSITIHHGFVTIGINGEETNLSHELIQFPESIFESVAWVQVNGSFPLGITDYYVDNLVAYTSTGATIDEILTLYNNGVETGTIVGRGNRFPNFRLWLMQTMLQAAAEFIDQGRIWLACFMLNGAHRRCDGEPRPMDFIEGESVPALIVMIEDLMAQIGCD